MTQDEVVAPTAADVNQPDSSTTKTNKENDNNNPSGPYPPFTLPSTLPRPPFLDVDGVANFRGLGGYPSADGRHAVRPGVFYRCAHPMQITTEGLETLVSDLGVRAVYDLRSGPEVARTTAAIVSAAAAANHAAARQAVIVPSVSAQFESLRVFTPVYAQENTSPEALARKLGWYTSSPTLFPALPYSYSEGFVNAYRDIALHGVPAYTTIFRHILTRPTDPMVFHCTAGKDRTGVLAALILRLASVPDDCICWDYALTEPGLGAWRDVFIDRITAGASVGPNGPDHSSERMTRAEAARIVGSRAPNMRAFLTLVLDGEFGGAEQYLREKCGFSELDVRTIKENIVVDLEKEKEEGRGGTVVVKPCAIVGWTPEDGVVDLVT